MNSPEQPEPYAIGAREQKGTEALSESPDSRVSEPSESGLVLNPLICDLLKVPKLHHDMPL